MKIRTISGKLVLMTTRFIFSRKKESRADDANEG